MAQVIENIQALKHENRSITVLSESIIVKGEVQMPSNENRFGRKHVIHINGMTGNDPINTLKTNTCNLSRININRLSAKKNLTQRMKAPTPHNLILPWRLEISN